MSEVKFTCGERLLLRRCPKAAGFHACIKTVTMSKEKYDRIMQLPVRKRNFTASCKKHKCRCGLEFRV